MQRDKRAWSWKNSQLANTAGPGSIGRPCATETLNWRREMIRVRGNYPASVAIQKRREQPLAADCVLLWARHPSARAAREVSSSRRSSQRTEQTAVNPGTKWRCNKTRRRKCSTPETRQGRTHIPERGCLALAIKHHFTGNSQFKSSDFTTWRFSRSKASTADYTASPAVGGWSQPLERFPCLRV